MARKSLNGHQIPNPETTSLEADRVQALSKIQDALTALTQPSNATQAAAFIRPSECTPEEWAQHLVDAFLDRLVTRFPKPGMQCPFTGLNRNQLYEHAAGKSPVIQMLSLKEKGERCGARFFFVGSAIRYLRETSEYQSAPSSTQNKKKHGNSL